MSNVFVRTPDGIDHDIRDFCEIKDNTYFTNNSAKKVDGWQKIQDKTSVKVLSSNESFVSLNGDNTFNDALNGKFLTKSGNSVTVQKFLPKYGLFQNKEGFSRQGLSATSSDSDKTYAYKTSYDTKSNTYTLYELVDGAQSSASYKNVREFLVEFCGGGSTGTYAKFTAGLFAASCDGAGGGGAAAGIVIKVVPMHTKTKDVTIVSNAKIAKQARTSDGNLQHKVVWLAAGAWGHNGTSGSATTLQLCGITLTAGGGIASGGSGGGTGGSPSMTIPNLNDGEAQSLLEDSNFGISGDLLNSWSYDNGTYITRVSKTSSKVGWYVVYSKSSNEPLFKWCFLASSKGANGGSKMHNGADISKTINVNGKIDQAERSYNYSGGQGFDAADPAAPAGGGASLFGDGGSWESVSGNGNMSAVTGNGGNGSATNPGPGGGGASGVALKVFITTWPTGGNCAWYCPGWGSAGLLRIVY